MGSNSALQFIRSIAVHKLLYGLQFPYFKIKVITVLIKFVIEINRQVTICHGFFSFFLLLFFFFPFCHPTADGVPRPEIKSEPQW